MPSAEALRVKRAATLLVLIDSGSFRVFNFLSRSLYQVSPGILQILRALDDWTPLGLAARSLQPLVGDGVADAIPRLIETGLLVCEGTREAAGDAEYSKDWRWGPLAGAYHFATQDTTFVPTEVADEVLTVRAALEPSPPLFTTNADFAERVPLPMPNVSATLMDTVHRRRTHRSFEDQEVPLDCIAAALRLSLGITHLVETAFGTMPLSMTPSGGARNPFEAYVVARSVTGLNAGVYHYSALEHDLGCVKLGTPAPLGDLLAAQRWADSAAAVIVLVADFARSMWKYRDPGAYRVVAIEAGHIAQNIILTVTAFGVRGNPTGAISERLARDICGYGGKTTTAMYAIALGWPGADPLGVETNQ